MATARCGQRAMGARRLAGWAALLAWATGCAASAAAGGSDAQSGDAAAVDSSAEVDGAVGGGCKPYATGAALGALKTDKLDEISGMAESRRNVGVLWMHNDAGDQPRLFAVNLAGQLLAEVAVPGAQALDWEDIAIGPGLDPTAPSLYIADIGDNAADRAQVTVYRAPEPIVDPGTPGVQTALSQVEAIHLRYPDGPRDAEALLIDPLSGDLLLVSKESDGKSKVYRAKAPLQAGALVDLAKVGKLEFGKGPLPGDALATAAAVAADGLHFAIRTRDHAFEWARLPGESLPQALFAAPCVLPLRSEDQGEALSYAADGSGLYTVSEGKGAKILFYSAP